MKRLLRVWQLMGGAGCFVMLASGCATVQDYSLSYKVWDNDAFCKWNDPQPNPHLALWETSDHAQVLVEYDAYSEKHSVVKRQA
jgi:hypothetical protein